MAVLSGFYITLEHFGNIFRVIHVGDDVDVEHAQLLMQVTRRYATTEAEQQAILRGARASLMIDRVYRGHLADMVEALP